MKALRRLAERTPTSRDRYIDLLRALAILAVVLGHWLVSVIGYTRHGQLTGHSALDSLTWAYPLTWLVQVMPIFFIVGGFANATSLTSHRREGGDAISWLHDRSGRLIPPTTALFVALACGGLVARPSGTAPGLVRFAIWVASIPLWFLSAYLVVVVLTPLMYGLHQRFGLRVLGVLVGLVALGDVVRLEGTSALGEGNFVFGWLAVHQVGFFWRDGRLPSTPRTWVPLLVGGLSGLVLLTTVGPYPVTMVDVPGQYPHNASPPTLALLADTAMQLGLVVLLRDPAERWLWRAKPWLAVVSINAVVLTIFLWHMSALVLLVGILNALHLLPTPPAATTAWWLLRMPWLMALAGVLALLVAVFGPLETRRRRRPVKPPDWLPDMLAHASTTPVFRALLTATGFAAVVFGLLSNNVAPNTAPYLLGMPAAGLAAFLGGAGVLRLLRSMPSP